MRRKILIVGGAGMVGSVAAYSLIQSNLDCEILMIDIDQKRLEGQVMDLSHSTSFSDKVSIRIGDYSEIEDNDIVVICAGYPQKPGESRLDLVDRNSVIVKDIIGKVVQQGKDIYILIATNPVDVLTYTALMESGLNRKRVFGTGTCTDTARLHEYIKKNFKVSFSDFEAYFIGEHGQSGFVSQSLLKISDEIRMKIDFSNLDLHLKSAANEIITRKGATYFGVGRVISEIVSSIITDSNRVMSICSAFEGEYGLSGVAIGLPHKINSNGAEIISDLKISEDEIIKLSQSAEIIKNAINSIKQD